MQHWFIESEARLLKIYQFIHFTCQRRTLILNNSFTISVWRFHTSSKKKKKKKKTTQLKQEEEEEGKKEERESVNQNHTTY